MTIAEYKTKSENSSLQNYEDHPDYVSYVNLLKEYFEIKNDKERLQQKFTEIISKHQQLVRIGIIK